MPGLVGFFGKPPAQGSDQLLGLMARSLDPGQDSKIWSYFDPSVGLARVSPAIVNPEPQPIWDASGQVCVFLEGEIYDQERLRQQLEKRGYIFKTRGDGELILNLYLETGDLFPPQLNGMFAIAILDRRLNKLIIVTDRLGLYPLYYVRTSERILFSSKVSSLLAVPGLARTVDKTAIAQFLTFDHVLGDRTYIHAAKLMPQGSVMTIGDGEFSITPYSSLHYPKEYELRPEEEYIDEVISLLRQAVHRQAQDDYPKAVLLSGGMDSAGYCRIVERSFW